MRSIRTACWLVLLSSCFVATARAQPFNPSINPTAAPITIKSDPEKLAVRSKLTDQKLINVAFGATVNGGNTKTYAGNAGGRFGLIRNNHQLMAEALGTLGGARQGGLTDVKWNARSVIARVRYDLFLSQSDALFLAIAPRRDLQAGLDLRLQNQIGYLRNLFFFTDAHRFWAELGYDFSYDNYARLSQADREKATMEGKKFKDPKLVHSGRLFLGYTNRLSPSANLSMGVEGLYDLEDPKNVRVNGLAELTSTISGSFKLGLQSRVLFSNKPALFKEPYDVIMVAQLVYTFDSAASTPLTVCPACDCTAQVQAAKASCALPEAGRQQYPTR